MSNNFIGTGENAAMLSGAEYDEEKGSYVMPKRKTALRMACEKLYDKGYKACTIDGFCANQGLDREECIVCIQRHFQQQADISDGWDVVKTKIKDLKSLINRTYNSDKESIHNNIYLLEQMCKQAEIEKE